MTKANDRYDFVTEIEFSEIVHNSDGSNIYLLPFVVVRNGDINDSAYFMYVRLNPVTEPDQWVQFCDDEIRPATENAAVDDSFGQDRYEKPRAE